MDEIADRGVEVRRAILQWLSDGHSSVTTMDIVTMLDLRPGIVDRELLSMRREGILDGRPSRHLYWLPMGPEDGKPVQFSVQPRVGQVVIENHYRRHCVSSVRIRDEIGRIIEEGLQRLADDGFKIGDGQTVYMGIRFA